MDAFEYRIMEQCIQSKQPLTVEQLELYTTVLTKNSTTHIKLQHQLYAYISRSPLLRAPSTILFMFFMNHNIIHGFHEPQ